MSQPGNPPEAAGLQAGEAALQVDRCLRAFEEDITEQNLPTDQLAIGQAAERVAEMTGLVLSENHRSGPRKALDRAILQIRHIR